MKKMMTLGFACLSMNAFGVCQVRSSQLLRNNHFECQAMAKENIVDFSYRSSTNTKLYISYKMEMGCQGTSIKKLEWLTLNPQGEVVSQQEVVGGKFSSQANVDHKLRLHIASDEGCDFYGADFGVDEY